jgi:hypothetical protein
VRLRGLLGAWCAIAACGGGHKKSPDAAQIDADVDAPPGSCSTAKAPICSADHLCWDYPAPQGSWLFSISGGGCDYWLSGNSSFVFHLDGTSFTRLALAPEPTYPPRYIQIFESAPNDVWAAGAGLQHFDGTQWTQLLGVNQFVGVWGAAPGDIWFGDSSGNVWHWDGSKVTELPTLGTNGGIVAGTAANDVWYAANPPWHFDGASWTSHALPDATAYVDGMWGIRPDDWYAMGGSGTTMPIEQVWHWDGTTWTSVYQGALPGSVLENLQTIWGSASNDIWTLGPGLGHLIHFDGAAWQAVALPTAGAAVSAIHGTASDDVVFAGRNGYLARWNGSAIVELSRGADVSQNWTGVWGASASDVWLVNDNGSLRHFDGTSWSDSALSGQVISGISGTATNDAWLSAYVNGPSGVAWHWDGASWTSTSLGRQLVDVWASAANDAWALDYNNAAFHFDGTMWTPTTPGTGNAPLRSIWGTTSDAWIAGTDALAHWTGSTWSGVSAGTSGYYEAVWGRSSTEVYVGDSLGHLFVWNGTKFTDLGASAGNLQITSIGGDATRMWVTHVGGVVDYDDGSGMRRLDTQAGVDLSAAWFPSAADGWVAGAGVFRYSP